MIFPCDSEKEHLAKAQKMVYFFSSLQLWRIDQYVKNIHAFYIHDITPII